MSIAPTLGENSYTYFPKKKGNVTEERITVNEALCTKCDERIRSIAKNANLKCKCGNVCVGGGTNFIVHTWKYKDHYKNKCIIFLGSD